MGIHRVFLQMDKRQTMQEMRAHFRKVGVESFKRIGMIHFLNYGYDWVELVNAPHLGNAEGIEKAKQIVEEVAFAEAESAKAAEAAKKADEAAKVALDDANVKAEEVVNEEKHTALQKNAETGSLHAKNAALYELAEFDKEEGSLLKLIVRIFLF